MSINSRLKRSLALRGARPERRAGDGVLRNVGVDIEFNARVAGLIEGSPKGASGLSGAAARDLEVNALRVV